MGRLAAGRVRSCRSPPLLLIPLVFLLVPERPASIGLTRYGATGPEPAAERQRRQFPGA